MFTQVQLLQIKNAVMRILHVPGNYSGGILEMAIVADYDIPYEKLRDRCAQIAGALKQTDETFRNVRVNLIKWISDEQVVKEIASLPLLQMGRTFGDYEEYQAPVKKKSADKNKKSIDELFRQLKLFYARSKLIIILTDGNYRIVEEQKVQEYLNPFLKRKILLLQPQGNTKYGICIELQQEQ